MLFNFSQGLLGPFIGGDEFSYFEVAKSIHAGAGAGTQYNPLYPLIIGFLNIPHDMILTYDLIKIANFTIYAAIVFPIYFLSRVFLPPGLSLFLAIITLLLPAGSMSLLIWAEPLYYFLFITSVLFFVKFLELRSLRHAIGLGLFVGLTFLAKQSGLILFIAMTICLSWEPALDLIRNKKFNKNNFVPVFVSALLIFGWLVRNYLTPGAGLLGYGGYLSTRNPHYQLGNLIANPLFCISYLIHAGWFVFPLLFVASALQIRALPYLQKYLVALTLFCTLGIIAFCDLAISVIPGYEKLPQGRYLCVLIPLIFLVGLIRLHQRQRADLNLKVLVPIGVVLFLVVLFCNNVPNTVPYNIINGPDLAYIHSLFYPNTDIYTRVSEDIDQVNLKICGFFVVISVLIIFVKSRWNKMWPAILVLFFSIYSGYLSYQYILSIGGGPTINGLFRVLAKSNIKADDVFFDQTLDPQSIAWYSNFWYGKNTQSANRVDVEKLKSFSLNDLEHRQSYFITTSEIKTMSPLQELSFGSFFVYGFDHKQ